MNHLRPLLENNNARLTYSSHLAQIVPFLSEVEMGKLKDEVSSAQRLVVIFDGSTYIYLGEALAILLRYVTNDDWTIQQRLVRFHVLSKSLCGPELARELGTCLSTQFQLPPNKLIAAVRDGAAVNGAALRQVRDLLYPNAFDVICISHSLDNVGKNFNTPTLDEFTQWWVALFSRSPAARLAWRAKTGVSIKSHSSTRWWSLYEVQNQLLQYYGDVEEFLEECQWSPAACGRLLDIVQNRHSDNSHDLLRIELAATIDAAKVFVQITYTLKGDGMLAVDAYTHLQEVATATADAYYPNVDAMAKCIAPGRAQQQREWMQHARQCVQPAINYFLRRFNHQDGDLFQAVRAFKAARLCCPKYVNGAQPTLHSVDQLRLFPVLDDDEMIHHLKEELAAYKVAATDVPHDVDRLQWWRAQEALPAWRDAARVIMSIPPSSAAAERVFPLLAAATSKQQERLLEDQLELAIMLQYNRGRSSEEL